MSTMTKPPHRTLHRNPSTPSSRAATYHTFATSIVQSAILTSDPTPIHHLLLIAAHQAAHPSRLKPTALLPSWVPDWRLPLPDNLGPTATVSLPCSSVSSSSSSSETPQLLSATYMLRLRIQTFGLVDALVHHPHRSSFRLLRHRNLIVSTFPSLSSSSSPSSTTTTTTKTIPLQTIPLLQASCPDFADGDLLCHPVVWDEAQMSYMATVLRPVVDEHVVKCRVVGRFPLRVLGGEGTGAGEGDMCAEMEVLIY